MEVLIVTAVVYLLMVTGLVCYGAFKRFKRKPCKVIDRRYHPRWRQ